MIHCDCTECAFNDNYKCKHNSISIVRSGGKLPMCSDYLDKNVTLEDLISRMKCLS